MGHGRIARELKTVQNGDVVTLFGEDAGVQVWELVHGTEGFSLASRRVSLKESDLQGVTAPAFLVDTKATLYPNEKTPINSDLPAGGMYPEDYCPQDADHPRLPWQYKVGFVFDDGHRGLVEAIPQTVKTFDNGAAVPVKGMACYMDWVTVRCFAVSPRLDGKLPVAARLYRGRNGIFGLVAESTSTVSAYAYRVYSYIDSTFVDVTVNCTSPAFVLDDDGSSPDLGRQPPEEVDGDLGGTDSTSPRAVGYFEQRAVFGGSESHPRRIWLSRTGQPYEFATSSQYVPLDTDGMELDLDTSVHETVQNIETVNGNMVILTDRALWSVSPGLTPTDAKAVRFGGVGSCPLKPLSIRNSLLFVSSDRNKVYEVRPDQSGTQWATRELGMFARNILDGRSIVSWTYVETPDPTVWMAMDDGGLLTLSYCYESGLCAWTRHDSRFRFRDVMSMRGEFGESVFAIAEGPVGNEGTRLMRICFREGTLYLDGERELSDGESPSLPGWKPFSRMHPGEWDSKVDVLPSRASSGSVSLEGDPVRMQVELLDVDLYDDAGLRPKTLKRMAVDSVGNTSLRVSQAPGEYAPPEVLERKASRKVTETYVVHGYAPHATGCIFSEEPSQATVLGVSREVDYGDTSMRGADTNLR